MTVPRANLITQSVPSGFFVLRTALLAAEQWVELGTNARAASLDHASEIGEQQWESDILAIRDQLRALVSRPVVMEALYLGSATAHRAVREWLSNPQARATRRVEDVLMRYVSRMTMRETPFGLFAGISLGYIGPVTNLTVPSIAASRRSTTLSSTASEALVRRLSRQFEPHLRYTSSRSWYRTGGSVRFIESYGSGSRRSHSLVSAPASQELLLTLKAAEQPTRHSDLVEGLVAAGASADESVSYLRELSDVGLLESELVPPVTGVPPLEHMIDVLSNVPEAQPVRRQLLSVSAAIRDLNASPLGIADSAYEAATGPVAHLLDEADASSGLSVDLLRCAETPMLGAAVITELQRAVRLLHTFAPARSLPDGLSTFRSAFERRYGDEEVPLLEALDEDGGVGVPSAEQHTATSPVEAYKVQRFASALAAGAASIEVSLEELEALAPVERLPLPAAFAIIGALASESDVALARGDFKVYVDGLAGPSGARLLSRFCTAHPELTYLVRRHLRDEEKVEPETVFAEIVYLPEPKVGDVIRRPVLRLYEIPLLSRSGAPADKQISLDDLRISLRGGRVVLRSARLGREVRPSLTTAHNVASGIPLYRFLAMLASQGTSGGLSYTKGTLETVPHYPRVTSGRIVLSKASWRLTQEELGQLKARSDWEEFRRVQELRRARGLPRVVALQQAGQLMAIDFDNPLSTRSFCSLVRNWTSATIEEVFPAPGETAAVSKGSRITHLFVVPFTHHEGAVQRSRLSTPTSDGKSQGVRRTFLPGSEWAYLKFYQSHSSGDRVLRDLIGPEMTLLRSEGLVRRWFYMRYEDPDAHLRLRIQGTASDIVRSVVPRLLAAHERLGNASNTWRIVQDTYQREMHRYGGSRAIEVMEDVFCADSEACCALVSALVDDAAATGMWFLTLCSTDRLLDDFGLALDERRVLAERWVEATQARAMTTREGRWAFAERYRGARRDVSRAIVHGDVDGVDPACVRACLDERSRRIAPHVTSLRHLEQDNALTQSVADILPSLVHMHVNRMIANGPAAQEPLIFGFLARYYESVAARSRRPR